jgi:hypothetical protein
LAVGEGEGFQGLARHTPIDPVRCAITINGGRGIALSPDSRHGLGNVVGGGVEFAHTARIRIHHVKIRGLVRAQHQVGVSRGAPGSGQEDLSARADVAVGIAQGFLVIGGEVVQRRHRVTGSVELEETLSVIGDRSGLVESAVGGEIIEISRRIDRRPVARFPKGGFIAVGSGTKDA